MSGRARHLQRLDRVEREIVELTMALYTEHVLLNLPKDQRNYDRLDKLKTEQNRLRSLLQTNCQSKGSIE